jgi:hypothetical protein
MLHTLKDHVSGEATFKHYRAGIFYYQTHLGLEFQIPIEDTDGATFSAKEKGIYMMRWIKKFV